MCIQVYYYRSSINKRNAGWQPVWMILRLAVDRPEQPTAAVLDARTVQGGNESGPRSGYDGHKK